VEIETDTIDFEDFYQRHARGLSRLAWFLLPAVQTACAVDGEAPADREA